MSFILASTYRHGCTLYREHHSIEQKYTFFCHTYLSLRADPSSYFEFLDVRVSAFVADLSLLIITIIYQYTNKMSIKYVKLQVWYACHILYRYA